MKCKKFSVGMQELIRGMIKIHFIVNNFLIKDEIACNADGISLSQCNPLEI